MPTTPPLDNKQEPAEYATDHVGPDLDRDTLIRLLQVFRDPPDFKRETHGAWPVHKSKFTLDEIKESFMAIEPFVSDQRVSMHQVAAAMRALAHKGEPAEGKTNDC